MSKKRRKYETVEIKVPVTDGKSAYEIAIDNKFKGTEKEWLESLKGEKGQDGILNTELYCTRDEINKVVENLYSQIMREVKELLKDKNDENIIIPEEPFNTNKVPYISTYYINPKYSYEEDVVINFYVTDYEQKEYIENDIGEEFIIKYSICDKENLIKVKAGDNSINLGKLEKGEKILTLQAINKKGCRSHKLFIEFLVINPEEDKIKEYEIYEVTEDILLHFNIYSNNTNPIETTNGLNELLVYAKDNNYKRIILPNGIYSIDENNSIYMQDNLTLDMNGSTFKQNPNLKDSTMIITFLSVKDAHLINGIIEGDYFEHDYASSTHNSEWCNGITFEGGTKYCSVKNVVVKDIVGYGCNCGIGGTFENRGDYTYNYPLWIESNDFINQHIDNNGLEVENPNKCTNKNFINISEFVHSQGFIQVGTYLGYQGNPLGDTWRYDAHFYDENKKYLEKTEGYLYRKMHVPTNAKYLKITIYTNNKPKLSVFNFRTPTHNIYSNITMENNRAVGMALGCFNHMLVEDCSFINCGQTLACCAFDAEDGWDMMQDLTFRKNIFKNNPYNNFLTCGGHNFTIENNHEIGLYFWERTNGYVVRHNTINLGCFYKKGSLIRTGYTRIYNNIYQNGCSNVILTDKNNYVLKNETINQGVCYGVNNYYAENKRIKFIDCTIDCSNSEEIRFMLNTTYDNCVMKDLKAYISNLTEILNCTILDSKDLRFHTDQGDLDRGKKQEVPKIFKNTNFANCVFKQQGNTWSEFINCNFINTDFSAIKNKEDIDKIKFIDCTWDELSKPPMVK